MHISRRKFLGQASCAAIGSNAALSTLINLMSLNVATARSASKSQDYKALVCILLAGGNDSFNMIIPTDSTPYNEYQTTRSNLALDLAGLHTITPENAAGQGFALHPSFLEIKNLFESEKAAIVTNVGTLAEPLANRTDYQNTGKQKPLGLFSHSDQIQQWQTSVPKDRQAVGWGGRLADVMMDLNNNQNISMNISLSGKNVFQAGNNISEYSIKNTGNGAIGLEAVPYGGNAGFLTNIRNVAVDNMIAQNYANLFQTTLSGLTQNSIDAQQQFSEAIAAVAPFKDASDNDIFVSGSSLSESMHMIAKTIAARCDLCMDRQTFFVTFGGWDHHDEVLNNQIAMLGVLSKAMNEFNTALEQIGMDKNVTTFTISDFGRTLTSNGNGSDHAWGGNQIVVGGAVKGKKLYSNSPTIFPSLALDYGANPLNISNRGNLIPTTSVDEYFAELALWFGLDPSKLDMVLPNLSNFYTYAPNTMPMGFMDMAYSPAPQCMPDTCGG